ncbi:MAG: AmmeMemoRadiSam system protein A [Candidatus Omnitrophica bacterium]|nr:AmmeMemoRadiSam system protein A [Candidatus Omnitrophota bacterium]
MLNEEQQKQLLKIARETIENWLGKRRKLKLDVRDSQLQEKRGVFVTLRKDEQLRGCIGMILPEKPLAEAVINMAIESATGDPRFPPLSLRELKGIKIEISVLTVPKRVKDYQEIELGRDGVIVKGGFQQGVFLPQVATETGWTKEEFLENLCSHKAGLPRDAYRDKDTELYTFQAQVFSEE